MNDKKPLQHTKGPWEWSHHKYPYSLNSLGGAEVISVWSQGDAYIETDRNYGDNTLIINAHDAPHICTDPTCPGDINRRKIEFFDNMVLVNNWWKEHCPECSFCLFCTEGEPCLPDCPALLSQPLRDRGDESSAPREGGGVGFPSE